MNGDHSDREELAKLLSDYQKKCPARTTSDLELEAALMGIWDSVLAILKEADKLVAEARAPHGRKFGTSVRKRAEDMP